MEPPKLFDDALADETRDILDACVACGRCFEVCPTAPHAGLAEADPLAVTAGVRDILSGAEGTEEAARFANTCMGSGFCIEACEYGVNPRLMLSLAVQRLSREDARTRRKKGVDGFRKVAEGSRTLFRLVTTEEERARLENQPDTATAPSDITFYTGCNVLKTPHIVFYCLDVIEALGVRAAVVGGPSHCCGVAHWRGGDRDTAGRFANASADRFTATGARGPVLAWCPTCQVQFSEINLPARRRMQPDDALAMQPFLPWLAAQLDALRPLMRHRVERRIGLHEHPGVKGVSEAAEAILRAIPGVEFVDLEQPRDGWMCNTLATLPEYKRDSHARLLDAAAAAGVDTLCGVYHACHRELCAHEAEWPFDVVNIMEVIGETMGFAHEDRFKALKSMQNVDAVLSALMPKVTESGLPYETIKRVVERDLLGEQPLPLKGDARR